MSIVKKIEDMELLIAELKKLVVGTETKASAGCYQEPWYKSIPPEGIACYVSDWCTAPGTRDSDGMIRGVPRKVIGYIEGERYCFKVEANCKDNPKYNMNWIYAEPVWKQGGYAT